MPFRKYDKIHRLGKEETDGILEGTCYIEEKIDGANTSIWLEDGNIKFASRNRELLDKDSFNGFCDYVIDSNIWAFIHNHPHLILYGEWLVPHTIRYADGAYKNWYLFDAYNRNLNEYENPTVLRYISKDYNILSPWPIAFLENPTVEQLKEYLGKSALGDKGEGIVIKNPQFINKFGDRVLAKMVTPAFMEDNSIVFGSNNKQADNYQELYFVQKYITEARLHKILNKIQPEINERLDLQHIPRVCNTVYYDMISEEAWEIAKLNKTVDFKQLKNLAFKRAKYLYQEYLAVV